MWTKIKSTGTRSIFLIGCWIYLIVFFTLQKMCLNARTEIYFQIRFPAVYILLEENVKSCWETTRSAQTSIDCVLSEAKFNNAADLHLAVEIMMRSASLQSSERDVLKFRSLSPALHIQPAVLNTKWLFAPQHFSLQLQPNKNTNRARVGFESRANICGLLTEALGSLITVAPRERFFCTNNK
jgi:hypothetical protein